MDLLLLLLYGEKHEEVDGLAVEGVAMERIGVAYHYS